MSYFIVWLHCCRGVGGHFSHFQRIFTLGNDHLSCRCCCCCCCSSLTGRNFGCVLARPLPLFRCTNLSHTHTHTLFALPSFLAHILFLFSHLPHTHALKSLPPEPGLPGQPGQPGKAGRQATCHTGNKRSWQHPKKVGAH